MVPEWRQAKDALERYIPYWLQEKLYLCLYYLALTSQNNSISDWSKVRYLHKSSSHVYKKIIPSIKKHTACTIKEIA